VSDLSNTLKSTKNEYSTLKKERDQCLKQSKLTKTKAEECKDIQKTSEKKDQEIEELKKEVDKGKETLKKLKDQGSFFKKSWLRSLIYDTLSQWMQDWGVDVGSSMFAFVMEFLYIALVFFGSLVAFRLVVALKNIWREGQHDRRFMKEIRSFRRTPSVKRFRKVVRSMRRLSKTPRDRRLTRQFENELFY